CRITLDIISTAGANKDTILKHGRRSPDRISATAVPDLPTVGQVQANDSRALALADANVDPRTGVGGTAIDMTFRVAPKETAGLCLHAVDAVVPGTKANAIIHGQ